jgi:phosphoserine phosphatase
LRGPCVKLVVFDMDGVLVDIHSSWEYLHEAFGVKGEARVYKRWFEEGRITYEEWMRLDVSLWIRARGRIHRRELEALLEPVKPRKGAIEAVRELKSMGIGVSIVSGGIDLLARRIAGELGISEWRANILSFDEEGYLQPSGIPMVGVDKSRVVEDVARRLGARLEETMFVGDSKWDLTAMRIVGYPVLFLNEKTGGEGGELLEAARYTIRSLDEVPRIVKKACADLG